MLTTRCVLRVCFQVNQWTAIQLVVLSKVLVNVCYNWSSLHLHFQVSLNALGSSLPKMFSADFLNDLIKPWPFLCSLASNVVICLCCRWHILILDHCVNITDGEVNASDKFVVIIDSEPFFYVYCCHVLKELRDVHCTEFLLLQYFEIVVGFRFFTKLITV